MEDTCSSPFCVHSAGWECKEFSFNVNVNFNFWIREAKNIFVFLRRDSLLIVLFLRINFIARSVILITVYSLVLIMTTNYGAKS